jgi:hypothetical protein
MGLHVIGHVDPSKIFSHPLPLLVGERGRVRGNFKYFSLEFNFRWV